MAGRPRPRLPLAPVLPMLGVLADHRGNEEGHDARLAHLLGVTRRTACRITAEGALADHHGDRLAAALGLHPANIWPDEWAAIGAGR